MLTIPVTHDLICEVPQERERCKTKSPHCYITRNKKIVAIVYINPITIQKGADLLEYEKDDVISIVKENQYELEEEYRRVANGW